MIETATVLPARVSWLLFAALLALASEPAATAHAATPKQEADLWYERGDRAFTDGRYEEAADAFARSHAAIPDPVACFMAARSFEAADQLERAIEWFERFGSYEDAPRERRDEAAERVETLRDRLSQRRYDELMKTGEEALTLEAYEGAARAFAAAHAERPTPESLWAWARALDASGDRDGAIARLRELLAADGVTPALRAIAAERLELLQRPADPEPTEEPPQPTIETTPPSPWGWVGIIAGAALVGGGVGFHFWAEGLRDQVRKPASTTAAGTIDSISQRRAAELQSEADYIDGGAVAAMTLGSAAAIGGAIVLLVTGGDPIGTELTVTPVAGGGVVLLGGAF